MSDEVKQCIGMSIQRELGCFRRLWCADTALHRLQSTSIRRMRATRNYSRISMALREVNDQEKFRLDPAHLRMYWDFGNRFMTGRSGKILDVGAGLGYFVRFAESYQDWEAFGYEICAPAVDYAKNQLGVKNMYAGRVEDSGFPLAYFDLITLWDVIEHIPNPDGFLQ